jgi:N-methylhydantoinase A/oxoprolinase/acetone carboxylase beta subunit
MPHHLASHRVFTAGKFRATPVFYREQLSQKHRRGPALIVDYGATTLVPGGWQFLVDRFGNLIARR